MIRVLLVLVATVVSLVSYSSVVAEPGVVDLVAVDVDPSGNEPNGPLGPVDGCREVALGETFSVDVVVDEIDPADGIGGWQFAVAYDPSVLRVVDYDLSRSMLEQAGGPFFDFTDEVPDSDGHFLVADVDFGPPAEGEFGVGILSGLTFESVGSGVSGLGLESVLISPSTETSPDLVSEIEPATLGMATVTAGGASACGDFESDHDLDGICDEGSSATYCTGTDNCDVIANSGQADQDGDGLGDVCDICPETADHDSGAGIPDTDGVPACADVCPNVDDPGQEDSDGDGEGDACEPVLAIEIVDVDCPTLMHTNVAWTCTVELELTNLDPQHHTADIWIVVRPGGVTGLLGPEACLPNDTASSQSTSDLQPLESLKVMLHQTYTCPAPRSGEIEILAFADDRESQRNLASTSYGLPLSFEVVEGPAAFPKTGGQPQEGVNASRALMAGLAITLLGLGALGISRRVQRIGR